MEMEAPEIDKNDSIGKLIGIQTAILAVLLSIFYHFLPIASIRIRCYSVIKQATHGPITRPSAFGPISWK